MAANDYDPTGQQYGAPDASNGDPNAGAPGYHYDEAQGIWVPDVARTQVDNPATTQGPGAPPAPPAPPPTPPNPPPPPPPPGGILAPFSEAAPNFPQMAPFAAPREAPAPFSYADFKPPSIADAFDDPAYQWEKGQTLDSLNRWAGAKGTLNDSGTARAFEDLGNNVASQRLGDVWTRDFSAWDANRNNAFQTYGANLQSQYVLPNQQAQATYGVNRQTQSIDPYTALYNDWVQRGNWYNQNQSTAASTALGFGQL